MTATLYGLGVGPGDPELLTLKAHRILSQCKVVAYPAPDNGESFARSIVADFINADKTEIPIVIPMRIERFPATEIYEQKAAEIAVHLDAGSDVAVLCEGDPFFYGSFMYLYERLAGKYKCEVVPGVSSLVAAPAAMGRPLAARNDTLTVIPSPIETEQIRTQLQNSDAIAFIKLGRHFARIRELIESEGLMDRAGYVERVGLPNQKIMPLADVNEDNAPYFSMILIYKGAEDWISEIGVGDQEA